MSSSAASDAGDARLLVRAICGGEADTDRLEEERARGLTIEIGFAEWKLPDGVEVGIVDLPGHEKFVRNMVAGATGMDCVLLVVAADDGVMPQTREHLQIMTLLGLRTGAVALTKIDLVEPDMRDLVVEDVRALLGGTFLADAPLFPVSSTTGVMWRSAMRTASIATSKQSLGLLAAITGTGASALRP